MKSFVDFVASSVKLRREQTWLSKTAIVENGYEVICKTKVIEVKTFYFSRTFVRSEILLLNCATVSSILQALQL